MKDLNKVTLEELKAATAVHHDGDVKDIDDFLEWAWERDIQQYKYEAKAKEGTDVLEVW